MYDCDVTVLLNVQWLRIASKMADVEHNDSTNLANQSLPIVSGNVVCCGNCDKVKGQLNKLSEELISTRSIIALLQDDIMKITAAGVAKPPQHQNNHPSARDYSNHSSGNWIPVLHTTRSNNPILPVKKFNRQLIPLFNRFTPLMDVQEPSESSPNNIKLNKERSTRLKKPVTAIRNKILILGDSHARNCSINVQHNLKKV